MIYATCTLYIEYLDNTDHISCTGLYSTRDKAQAHNNKYIEQKGERFFIIEIDEKTIINRFGKDFLNRIMEEDEDIFSQQAHLLADTLFRFNN